MHEIIAAKFGTSISLTSIKVVLKFYSIQDIGQILLDLIQNWILSFSLLKIWMYQLTQRKLTFKCYMPIRDSQIVGRTVRLGPAGTVCGSLPTPSAISWTHFHYFSSVLGFAGRQMKHSCFDPSMHANQRSGGMSAQSEIRELAQEKYSGVTLDNVQKITMNRGQLKKVKAVGGKKKDTL